MPSKTSGVGALLVATDSINRSVVAAGLWHRRRARKAIALFP